MIELFQRYKWYILGYLFYVSIVLASIWNQKREFWPLVFIYCIAFPIAIYAIASFIRYWKKKKLGNKS